MTFSRKCADLFYSLHATRKNMKHDKSEKQEGVSS